MKKIIDLTLNIEEGMTTFPVPWHPFVEITKLGRLGIEKRETRKMVIGTHTGTHIDAPKHFIKNGMTVDAVDLRNLFGLSKIIDFSRVPDFYEIKKTDIEKHVSKKNKFKILILKFNWDKNLDTDYYYSQHPYLSEEAAKYISNTNIKVIGMDTPMPDNPLNDKNSKNDSPVHKILLKKNIFILEYLCNLKKINKNFVNIIIAPLKIKNGDGAPCRVWAY